MTTVTDTSFSKLHWREDRVTVDGWTFMFQHGRAAEIHADDHFTFYKLEPMMADYEAFFRTRPSFRVRTFLELGLWDGGSLALWMELLNPDHAVGVDILTTGESPYLQRYLNERWLRNRVETHWGVDQSDAAKLRAILADHQSSLDLVIDDASHLYGPTLSSFEAIFPMLQPGGLYIIEDWAWEHWPEYSGKGAIWGDERPMADLIHDLLRFSATSPSVASLSVYKDFVVVERSSAGGVPVPFELADHLVSRRIPWRSRAGKLRRFVRRVVRRLRRVLPLR